MELEYTDGCICTSLTVNGVETIDMDIKDFAHIICRIYDLTDDKDLLHDIFEGLVYSQGHTQEMIYDNNNIFGNVAVSTISFESAKESTMHNRHFTFIDYNYGNACIIDESVWVYVKTTEINKRFHSLIEREKDLSVLQSIFCKFMEKYGTYSCSPNPCDCCGDHIRTWKHQLKK